MFHGTLGRLKGIGVLAEALREVLPEEPEMHFMFAGKDHVMGPDQPSSVAYLRQRLGPWSDRLHFLGSLPHVQLYPVLAGARGSVLPSLVDNMPNACLEAMAHGRIVIGTLGGSFDEMLEDGVTGFLVGPGDPQDLAQAMRRLWRLSEGERSRIGEAARSRVEKLSPAQVLPKLEQFYYQTIASWRRS